LTEAEARNDIVSYCTRLYERGLVAGSSGNVSLRLEDGTIVVTPTGASLRALSAGDLVRCTADGAALDRDRKPTSELPLHLAAYRVRTDVRCVVHTHPTYCVAWSKTGGLFPLDTVGAIESLGPIAWTRYARSGTQELADICSEAFARAIDTIVMERHGLSSVAGDLETAFVRTDLAEQTARIEFAAFALRAAKGRGMADERPQVPLEELRAAAGDHPDARQAVEDFHGAFTAATPDSARVAAHAERLRGYDNVAGAFERWWLDPRVQTFLADLNATGI
jgi:L-fuculose-phosphate aldolase